MGMPGRVCACKQLQVSTFDISATFTISSPRRIWIPIDGNSHIWNKQSKLCLRAICCFLYARVDCISIKIKHYEYKIFSVIGSIADYSHTNMIGGYTLPNIVWRLMARNYCQGQSFVLLQWTALFVVAKSTIAYSSDANIFKCTSVFISKLCNWLLHHRRRLQAAFIGFVLLIMLITLIQATLEPDYYRNGNHINERLRGVWINALALVEY